MKMKNLLFKPVMLGTLVVLGFITAPAHAKTYYVSQSAGDDASTGEFATRPWKTLAKASIQYPARRHAAPQARRHLE